jgi:hypothetical protein
MSDRCPTKRTGTLRSSGKHVRLACELTLAELIALFHEEIRVRPHRTWQRIGGFRVFRLAYGYCGSRGNTYPSDFRWLDLG